MTRRKLPNTIKRVDKSFRKPPTERAEVSGFDAETEHTNGTPKLFSFAPHDATTRSDVLTVSEQLRGKLVHILLSRVPDGGIVSYWRDIDAIAMVRILTADDRDSLIRIGKLWQKSFTNEDLVYYEAEIEPVTLRGHVRKPRKVTIQKAIQGSLTIRIGKKTIHCFNIAKIYQSSLIKAAADTNTPYTKNPGNWPDEREVHIIDWQRFEYDDSYRNAVIESNREDALAHKRLAEAIQQAFYEASGNKYYPKYLYTAASITKELMIAMLETKDMQWLSLDRFLNERVYPNYGKDVAKDIYWASSAAYNAGLIDIRAVGTSPVAYTSDIQSAYPAIIRQLPDLRTVSEIQCGEGTPPTPKEREIVLCSGTVYIPHTNRAQHTLPVREKGTVEAFRYPNGTWSCCYLWEQREQAITDCGARFSNERWWLIRYEKVHPVSDVVNHFLRMRQEYEESGSPFAFIFKIAVNAIYGKMYQAIAQYTLQDDGNIVSSGQYEAGEIFNPLYATLICNLTRVKLAKACNAIERNGGTVFLLMTDGIYWCGSDTMLPQEMIRPKGDRVNNTGYFEPPTKVENLLVIGTGVYEYTKNGKTKTLHRGFDLGDEIPTWRDVLSKYPNAYEVPMKHRTLIGLPSVADNPDRNLPILGSIQTNDKVLQIQQARSKRRFGQYRHVINSSTVLQRWWALYPKQVTEPGLDTSYRSEWEQYEYEQKTTRDTVLECGHSRETHRKDHWWHMNRAKESWRTLCRDNKCNPRCRKELQING